MRTGPFDFTCWIVPAARLRLTPFPCGRWHISGGAAKQHALLLRRRFDTLADVTPIQGLPPGWPPESVGDHEPSKPHTAKQWKNYKYNHSDKGLAREARFRDRRRLAPCPSRTGPRPSRTGLSLLDALDEEAEVPDCGPQAVLEAAQ